jgi:hypothetical protein
MPRERLRVCLQDGLKLDLNWLIRRGLVQLDECAGPLPIQWLNSDTGEVRALGLITANLHGHEDQQSRPMGGSPRTSPTLRGKAVVFHLPRDQSSGICPLEASGRTQFCSRHAWVGSP